GAPGLATLRVQADESRQGHPPDPVHDDGPRSGPPSGVGPDGSDPPVGQQQVGGRATQRGDPAQQVRGVRHEAPSFSLASSRYSTAIRTATPFATCSTTTDRTESAASAEISSPRFIGPGCITIAWSGSIASRRESNPYARVYSRALGKKPVPDP